MSKILKWMGNEREKHQVSRLTNFGCVMGFICGIVFVVEEHLDMRQAKTRAVMKKETSSMPFPDIMTCNTATSFPPFIDLPKKYPGEPTA